MKRKTNRTVLFEHAEAIARGEEEYIWGDAASITERALGDAMVFADYARGRSRRHAARNERLAALALAIAVL